MGSEAAERGAHGRERNGRERSDEVSLENRLRRANLPLLQGRRLAPLAQPPVAACSGSYRAGVGFY